MIYPVQIQLREVSLPGLFSLSLLRQLAWPASTVLQLRMHRLAAALIDKALGLSNDRPSSALLACRCELGPTIPS